VTVKDEQGKAYTDTMAITVLNKAKVDAILKGKWEGMKARLMAGDIDGALGYFSDKAQNKYREIFGLLKYQLPTILPTFVEFNIVDIYEVIAEYEIVANEGGTLYSYPGILIKTGSGKWKFRDF